MKAGMDALLHCRGQGTQVTMANARHSLILPYPLVALKKAWLLRPSHARAEIRAIMRRTHYILLRLGGIRIRHIEYGYALVTFPAKRLLRFPGASRPAHDRDSCVTAKKCGFQRNKFRV